MGVLHYLDVMIGYALAMAILATLIGTFAGVFLTAFRTHTRHLRSAVATAIQNVQGMTPEQGAALAQTLLSDRTVKARAPWTSLPDPMEWPLVGWLVRFARGFAPETIHREELALLILRKAAAGDTTALAMLPGGASANDLLRRVERSILLEEKADPAAPAQVWRMRALAAHVPDLASQLFTHFDNLMDRMEDNVRSSGKVVSALAAAVFLYFAPVDSLNILNRLSADAELRKELVSAASELTPAKPVDTALSEDEKKAARQVALDRARKKIETAGLFGEVHWKRLRKPTWDDWMPLDRKELVLPDINLGVLITWAMVSMGAPFWLGALNKLLGLRSLVAQRGDQQRTLRDRDQRAAAAL